MGLSVDEARNFGTAKSPLPTIKEGLMCPWLKEIGKEALKRLSFDQLFSLQLTQKHSIRKAGSP